MDKFIIRTRVQSGHKQDVRQDPSPPCNKNPNQNPFPYDEYTDEDVKNRVIYVEASRGCPFKCEFCLSALDKTAIAFDLDDFLIELEKLYQRGVRHFKFVDRTFNLKIKNSIRILEFFLERLDENLFLHFELIPDHLPEKIKDIILKFPDGTLQFEIGIYHHDCWVAYIAHNNLCMTVLVIPEATITPYWKKRMMTEVVGGES